MKFSAVNVTTSILGEVVIASAVRALLDTASTLCLLELEQAIYPAAVFIIVTLRVSMIDKTSSLETIPEDSRDAEIIRRLTSAD